MKIFDEIEFHLLPHMSERILSNNVKDFQDFCDRVGQKAQDRGLNGGKTFRDSDVNEFRVGRC